MLMDEPFGAVDPIVRARLQDQFLDIQARLRKTIVFVTHDIDEAIKLADRIAILNVGGRARAVRHARGDPPRRRRTSSSSGFVGRRARPEAPGAASTCRDIEVEEGPVVDAATPRPTEADAEMEPFGFDWVERGRRRRAARLGRRGDARGRRTVGEAEPEPFSAYVHRHDSLRQALDSIVTSRTQVAVVVDRGPALPGHPHARADLQGDHE